MDRLITSACFAGWDSFLRRDHRKVYALRLSGSIHTPGACKSGRFQRLHTIRRVVITRNVKTVRKHMDFVRNKEQVRSSLFPTVESGFIPSRQMTLLKGKRGQHDLTIGQISFSRRTICFY